MRTGRETGPGPACTSSAVLRLVTILAACAVATAFAAEPVTREESAGAVLHALPGHAGVKAPARVAHSLSTATLTHRVYGYYPSWTGDDFSELRFDRLSHVAYFTGGCTADGTYSAGAWPFDELVTEAHAHGTRVMLVIPCFGAAKLDAVFANKTAFIAQVAAAFASGEVTADGVDLDFEGMSAARREDFPAFAAELAAAIRAVNADAEFAAALPAIDWSDAYDYAALAEVIDHLVIMGYGYHWSGGNPGPVSPLDYAGAPWNGYLYDLGWSVADYESALAGGGGRIDQVLLGLPYYGYDWPSTSFAIPGTKTANATSRTFKAAVALAGSGGGASFDAASQTSYFFYDASGTPHQLWFDDAQTLSMKYERAKEWGLGGVAIWALNYDRGHDELWDALGASFLATPTPTPAPTPHTVDPAEPQWRAPGEPAGDAAAGCSIASVATTPARPLAAMCIAIGLAAGSLSRRRER